MSKNNNTDPSDAEDYLRQLEWKSKNGYRRTPWYLIPKWKYKPISKTEYTNSSFSSIFVGLFIVTIGILLYLIMVKHSFEAVFGLIFALLVATILFFAIRDAEKNSSDE